MTSATHRAQVEAELLAELLEHGDERVARLLFGDAVVDVAKAAR